MITEKMKKNQEKISKTLNNNDDLMQEKIRAYEEKQKIAGKLYRKGFRLGDIKRVLDM